MKAVSSSADLGLFGPDSVTWRLHADPSMLIGGIRALLVQGLHPLAMAGVVQHSDFRNDPEGRLQRTTDYIMTTTFGDVASARAAAARVCAIHKRVSGVDDVTGRPYRADDPELLLWVHAAEVDSFLTAYRRYGGRLSDADADRYVAEMVTAAQLVGLHAEDVPRSTRALREYLESMDDELLITEPAMDGMKFILNPPMRLVTKPLWATVAAASVAILPPRIRRMYRLPWIPVVNPAVRVYVFSLARAMNVLLPRPPQVTSARDRARALAAAI
jgi:uncharacterized protein (DUF2236 family)